MVVGDGGSRDGGRVEASEAAGRVARDWHFGMDLSFLALMDG